MLTQLHEMKKKENEMVKDFDEMFDRLLRDFPNKLKPSDGTILLHYINAFEGQFGFLLRDKSPTNLEMAKECASKIEENLLSSKAEPFNTSRASSSKSESKKGVVNASKLPPYMMQFLVDSMKRMEANFPRKPRHSNNKNK